MKKSTLIFTTAAALGLMSSGVTFVYAETTPAATSEAQTSSLLQNVSASFVTSFKGPALSDPLAPYAPAPDGQRGTDAILFENLLTSGYKLSDVLTLGPSVAFLVTPVFGKEFTLLDPYLKLSHSKVMSTENFNLAASVRIYAPLSSKSQANGYITNLRSDQSMSYTIPNSRFSLGLNTFIALPIAKKAVVTNSTGKVTTLNSTTVYAGPNVSYQITPSLAATLLAEMGASRQYGAGLTEFNARTDYTNLAPGMSWDILPGMNLSPYLNIPIGYRIAADTTTLGCDFVWKFL
jgi:hypothetical protein